MFTSMTLTVICFLLVPFYIAGIALYFLAWFLCTVTGVGPLAQHLLSKRDRKLLDTLVKPHEGAVVELVPVPETHGKQQQQQQQQQQPRRLAVRWSPGNRALPPVVIPNGLGATLITIASLHDLLEAKGYPVLSYDRAGVGLSDPLRPGEVNSVDLLLADLKHLMDRCVPPSEGKQWIMVGPSMGSVVCQCFMARYPGDVCGFVNVDGLPFPFGGRRAKFLAAAKVYCLVAHLAVTGVLRPVLSFFGSGLLAQVATPPRFPVPVVRAQVNQQQFFLAIAQEMPLMMDLCDRALAAWGSNFDLAKLNPAELQALVAAAPAACGDALGASHGPGKWRELPRAPVERGIRWATREETRVVLTRLLARAAQQHHGDGGAGLIQTPQMQWHHGILSPVKEGEDENAEVSPASADGASTAGAVAVAQGSVTSVSSTSSSPAAAAEAAAQGGGGGGGASAAAADHTDALEAGQLRQEEEDDDAAAAVAPLWLVFQGLVVRVTSARSYDFGLASSFYDQQMQDLAAAEHSLHAHLAGDGRRFVFPTRSHDKMFFDLTGFIASQVDEVVTVVAERRGLPAPVFAAPEKMAGPDV